MSYWSNEKPGQIIILNIRTVDLKRNLVCPVRCLQSWIQSRPPPLAPTCPSLSSSTAGTSGRTCVCSASPRKSSYTLDIHLATLQFGAGLFRLHSALVTGQAAAAVSHFIWKVFWHSPLLTDSYVFFHSEKLFYLKPAWKCMNAHCVCVCICVLVPSDSSLMALVTVTALSEVTSEAPPPASIGPTCYLFVQGVAPGCCSGRP